MPLSISYITVLAVFVLLSGCTSVMHSPMMRLVGHVVPTGVVAEHSRFDPRFQYLRVVVEGNVIFLASDTPAYIPARTVGVWYSGAREVLRFKEGRLVATLGLTTDWRAVVLPELPSWDELVKANAPFKWIRVRDVMPGYRFGVHDVLVISPIPSPSDSHLKGIDSASLRWFEEKFDAELNGAKSLSSGNLPVARYAVDVSAGSAVVVYGEQCISEKLCLSWQRWPVHAEQSK